MEGSGARSVVVRGKKRDTCEISLVIIDVRETSSVNDARLLYMKYL